MNTPHPKSRDMIRVLPGIPRAERRRALRAVGYRGSKARRRSPNRAAGFIAHEQDQEHEVRQSARHAGLIVAPTGAELDQLKAAGKVKAKELVLP